MSEWVVRDATSADFDGWRSVFAAVASEGLWIGAEEAPPAEYMRPRFERGIDDPKRLSLVADADGEVVGYLHGDFELAGVVELGMAIESEWRGRGIGAALLDRCITWSTEHGAHKVMLQVWPHNSAAIALYKKAGFHHEGRLVRHWRRRNGELWDLLAMGLNLDRDAPGSPHPDAAS